MSLIPRNAETRRFLFDSFEDDVRDIIENIIENEDVDTDMVDRKKLFRMAVDIAKKRESYVPRTKKSKSTSKVVDLTLSVNKVAAKVAAASSVVKVEKDVQDDNDAKDKDTLDDELVNLDKNAQEMRSTMKNKYCDPKKSPQKKTKKKQTKKKQTKRKQTKKKQTATNERGEVLKPDMKVQGKWKGTENYGEWFDGVVVSVNNKKKTCHIRYDDGDNDKAVSFNDVSII